jgi:hypothetical protein
MSRNTTGDVTSATQLYQQRYRTLVEVFSFTGGTVRACTGGNFVIVGANTYSPVGNFASVENVQEDAGVFPRAVRMRISLLNSAAMYEVLNETMFQKPVKIYRASLTDSYTVAGTPQLAFHGFINQSYINHDLGDSYLEIEAETRLKQPGKAVYMDSTTIKQVMAFSSDIFFDLLSQIPLSTAKWGDHVVVNGIYTNLRDIPWKPGSVFDP